jgi:transposase InsO family protein
MNDPNTDPNSNSQQTALTRFRALNFIEDLLRCGRRLAQCLLEASRQPWPEENGDYYAVRTLEDWWYAYKKGGFNALLPAHRRDQGQSRVLDQATATWIVEQVTQSPQIPVKVLYGHWHQQGRPLPSVSVIYRHLRRQGLDRASLRAGRLESGPTKAFETPHVNDLWMVDFSPGPTLRVGDKSLPTHLCVLIDDHSRLLPFAAYYRQANTEAFHHALKEAVLRRGLPRKLYTDQGKPFINAHTRMVCAQLGIRLLHCRPYHSWSKGKIERVIFSIQQGFESTLRLEGNQVHDLDQLNTRLSAWIQTVYHQRIHSSIQESPEARFQRAAKSLRHLEADQDIDRLFYLRLYRAVRKNGTIRLDGQLYEVPLSLRALKVQLRLDPFTRQRIEVWYQNKLIGLARRAPLNLNSETGGEQAYDR